MPRGRPRNDEERPVRVGYTRDHTWVEINPDSTLPQFIHAFQIALERMPKGAENLCVARLETDGEQFNLNDMGLLSFKVEYEQPETPEQRIYRETVEREERRRKQIERYEQFQQMQQEFADGPPEGWVDPNAPVNVEMEVQPVDDFNAVVQPNRVVFRANNPFMRGVRNQQVVMDEWADVIMRGVRNRPRGEAPDREI